MADGIGRSETADLPGHLLPPEQLAALAVDACFENQGNVPVRVDQREGAQRMALFLLGAVEGPVSQGATDVRGDLLLQGLHDVIKGRLNAGESA